MFMRKKERQSPPEMVFRLMSEASGVDLEGSRTR